MFTHDNTDYAYTTDELAALNEALAARIEAGEQVKSAMDAINNLWFDGATAADLIDDNFYDETPGEGYRYRDYPGQG